MSNSLINLFADILMVDAKTLTDDSSPNTHKEWDSLCAMRLVVAIEEHFDVELSTKEIMRMSSIGLARETLVSKGVDI